jgi:hypothetical protein
MGVGGAYRFFDDIRSSLPLELSLSLTSFVPHNQPFAVLSAGATEGRAAASYWLSRELQATLGTGVGVASGWGNPDWRVFGGLC